MARVELIDANAVIGERKALLSEITTAFGATPAMFRAVANSPAALKMMWAGFGALVAVSRRRQVSTGPLDRALRRARVCYDHLSGEVAVAVADRMVFRGQLDFGQDGGVVTEQGGTFLDALGVDLGSSLSARSPSTMFLPPLLGLERAAAACRWVGRTSHVRVFHAPGWVRRSAAGRVVSITPLGASELTQQFGIVLGRSA